MLALPAIWAIAWWVNDKRARLFYIPYLPIVELMNHETERARTVGVIAALYVDATKLPDTEYDNFIMSLRTIAKTNSTEPLCRINAIRTLWFCYAKV